MTDWESMANEVRIQFKLLAADPLSLPTQYDNEGENDFTPPTNSPWARFAVQAGMSEQQEMGAVGGRTFRTHGRGVASVFMPLALGDQAALSLADSIAVQLRGVTSAGITYRSPSLKLIGRFGKWWQVNVDCPFYTEDLG